MSDAWFVVAPVGESQGSFLNPKVPDNSRIAEVATGSAAYNAWVNNGSYEGWQVVMGPFSSEAQAKAAHPPAGLNAILTAGELGAQTAAQSALGSEPNLPGPTISNPLAQLGTFFGDLTNRNTWLRVLKGLAGFALIVVGVIHLSGVASAASQAARPRRRLTYERRQDHHSRCSWRRHTRRHLHQRSARKPEG
jgi:hypothetical protein